MATDFQKKVWRICQKVPKGKVTTYRLLAKATGKINACRAVGNALNKNPYSPHVPCHRVVRSDSKIGGFADGVKKKTRLLEREGLIFNKGRITDLKKHIYHF